MHQKLGLILIGTAILAGCHKGNGEKLVVVEERYIHQYGMEIGANEWQTRGRNGQVIATLENGVIVAKQYSCGKLEGESTYTFPHSSTIEHVDSYEGNVLLKTVYNDQAGHPKEEVRHLGGNTKNVTSFYDSHAPRCKEFYQDDYLTSGEYFTYDTRLESRIDHGSGIKILRQADGSLVGDAVYENGKLVKETYFHPNGNPKEMIPYNKEGMIEGVKRTYLINGEPNSIEEWSQNQLNGKTTLFKNGEKFAEVPYSWGKKEGVERRYKDGSILAEEITWEKDRIHGPHHSYFGTNTRTEWYMQGQRVTRAVFDQQR